MRDNILRDALLLAYMLLVCRRVKKEWPSIHVAGEIGSCFVVCFLLESSFTMFVFLTLVRSTVLFVLFGEPRKGVFTRTISVSPFEPPAPADLDIVIHQSKSIPKQRTKIHPIRDSSLDAPFWLMYLAARQEWAMDVFDRMEITSFVRLSILSVMRYWIVFSIALGAPFVLESDFMFFGGVMEITLILSGMCAIAFPPNLVSKTRRTNGCVAGVLQIILVAMLPTGVIPRVDTIWEYPILITSTFVSAELAIRRCGYTESLYIPFKKS